MYGAKPMANPRNDPYLQRIDARLAELGTCHCDTCQWKRDVLLDERLTITGGAHAGVGPPPAVRPGK